MYPISGLYCEKNAKIMTSCDVFTCGKFARFHNYYTITSLFNPPKPLSLLYSVIHCLFLHTHSLLFNFPGGSQSSELKASRETGRKEIVDRKREAVIYKNNIFLSWHQSTLFLLFAMFPIFIFLFPSS